MPHSQPAPIDHHPFDAHPMRPAASAYKHSSKYLTPVQQQRIMSWRSTTSSSVGTTSQKAKSAPPSLTVSTPSTPSCSQCGKSCGCSSSSSAKSPTRPKGYYKKSKARGSRPAMPVSPAGGRASESRMLEQQVHYQPPPLPSPMYHETQVPLAPAQTLERQMAMPPKELPRIRGSRDPITQQYWKNSFPPVGGPVGINPGLPMMPGVHPMLMMGRSFW